MDLDACCNSNDIKIVVKCAECNKLFRLCLKCSHRLVDDDGFSECNTCFYC